MQETIIPMAMVASSASHFNVSVMPKHNARSPNTATIRVPSVSLSRKIDIRGVDGGMLIQDFDVDIESRENMKIVTDTSPLPEQWDDILFGWQIVKSVKSNAIVLALDKSTVGIGAGQMSDAAEIAIKKSDGKCRDSIMASDAFFPFADVAELAAENGIKAIIQPGGSIRDREVIDSCNKNKIPMIFTGKRHFKH